MARVYKFVLPVIFVVVLLNFIFLNIRIRSKKIGGEYENTETPEYSSVNFSPTRDGNFSNFVHLDFTGLQNEELSDYQQSCGTDFLEDYFGKELGEKYGVLEDIKGPTSPYFASVSSSARFLNRRLMVVILSQSEQYESSHGWISRSSSLGVDVHVVDSSVELFDLLGSLDSRDKHHDWVIVVSAKTYVILGNLLRFLESVEGESHMEHYQSYKYFGFPFRDKKIGLYASLDAGIILNKPSVSKIRSLEMSSCEFSVEICIGRIMSINGVILQYVDGLHPESPSIMLRIFEDADNVPPHFAISEFNSNHVFIPPISFGNCLPREFEEMENVGKIPKILHQIWVGDQEKRPEEELLHCKELYESHGWKHYLWTDANKPNFRKNLVSQKVYDSQKEWNAKGDILRYEVLFRYGGVALDADTTCLRVMDDLLEEVYDSGYSMFAVCENEEIRPGFIAAGTQGVTRNNLMYYVLLRAAQLVKNVDILYQERQSVGWITSGPLFFTRVIHNFNFPVMMINSKLFYPIHWSEIKEIDFAMDSQRIKDVTAKYSSYCFQYWGTTEENHVLLKSQKP